MARKGCKMIFEINHRFWKLLVLNKDLWCLAKSLQFSSVAKQRATFFQEIWFYLRKPFASIALSAFLGSFLKIISMTKTKTNWRGSFMNTSSYPFMIRPNDNFVIHFICWKYRMIRWWYSICTLSMSRLTGQWVSHNLAE